MCKGVSQNFKTRPENGEHNAVLSALPCSSKVAYLVQQSLRVALFLLLCMLSLAWSGNRALVNLARSPPRRASALVLKCSWSNKGNKNKMDFRVATYNILCSHLAEPTRFPQCSPRNLDAPTRLNRVKHKLDAEVSFAVVRARPCWLLAQDGGGGWGITERTRLVSRAQTE